MSHRSSVRLLGALLSFVLLLAVAPAMASAADLDVIEGGTDSGDCVAAACATIQYAVDQASDGDTITIGAGTFAGGVVVDTPNLTINGLARDETTVSGNGTQPGVFNLGDDADGLYLQYLTITGGGDGVYTNGSPDGVQIYDAVITANSGNGIEIGPDAVVNTFLVDTTDVTYNDFGMRVRGESTSPCICDSHFDHNVVGLASVSTQADPAVLEGLGIYDSSFSHDSVAGLSFDALSASQFQEVSVVDSGTATPTSAGIDAHLRFGDFSTIVLLGGRVTGASGPGIRLAGTDGGAVSLVAINGVNLVDNATGLEVEDGATNVYALQNRIVGNTIGIHSAGDAPDVDVEAPQNWWGCNAGPNQPGCDTVVVDPGASPVNGDPWTVLRASAASPAIALGGDSTTIEGALDTDSNGDPAASAGEIPFAFATDLGTVDPDEAESCSCGTAETTLTSGATAGTAHVQVTVDNQTVQADVDIVGPGPHLGVSPAALQFGSVARGTTSDPQEVTVRNYGDAPLTITAVQRSGTGASRFAATQDCVGVTLVAGDACTVSVTFSPTTIEHLTPSLLVASNGGNKQIALAGYGYGPVLSLSSPTVAFGDQPIGTSSTAKTVTVTNTGNSPMTVTGVARGGTGASKFTVDQDCTSAPVYPGESCTISTVFSPSAVGALTPTLALTSDGGNATINLSGTGTAPGISVAPNPLAFGSVVHGHSSTKPLTITNTGTAPLKVTGVARTGTGASKFTLDQTCTSAPIAPGASCTIQVTFSPTGAGLLTPALAITSNAGNPTVSLSGTGT
jgi:hypothetical protein